MSLPIPAILEELKDTPSSIKQVLQSLHHKSPSLGSLQKSELKHLISRTVNLAQSHQPYNKWCGINIINVLCESFAILAQEGTTFITILLKTLETSNSSTNINITKSTVECLDKVCSRIRGKPTLTREILTPKLPQIFASYMEKLNLYPQLIIKSLANFMLSHPTTFRPFGNKFYTKLVDLLGSPEFDSYSLEMKMSICRAIAILPIIEKNEPEVFWQNKLGQIVAEATDGLAVFKQLLEFNESSEIISTMDQMTVQGDWKPMFSPLEIDISKPETIGYLAARIEILLHLVAAFLTTETKLSVHVPIGKVIGLLELIFSINLRYTPLKGDIRDDKARDMIASVINVNQLNALKTLSQIIKVYPGPLVMHLSNILSFLETVIPFKNKAIVSQDIIDNEELHTSLLSCVSDLLKTVAIYEDASQLVRFVESALILVQSRDKPDITITSQVSTGKKNKNSTSKAASMADLLSHAHLLHQAVPEKTIRTVRAFMNILITRVNLPSKQHYKVMRYVIIEAVRAASVNNQGIVPQELKDLLINAVLYPGLESTSILPIVSSILGSDPLISVFNNPRLPPLPKLVSAFVDDEDLVEEEDDEQELEEQEPRGTKREIESVQDDAKRTKTDVSSFTEPKSAPVVDESKVFKQTATAENVLQFPEFHSHENETKDIEEPKQDIHTETVVQVDKDDNDNSDFEMPSIDIDGSDEEE